MEALRAIVTRRTTKKFEKTDTLSEETTMELLRAAMNAPSEENAKPWHFVIIKSTKGIRNHAILLKAPKTLLSAAMAIVVCADSSQQDKIGHWAIDCAAATENLILAAHAKGLGSTWKRVFPSKRRMKMVGDLLKTPHHITPFSVIFLGKPARAINLRAAPLDMRQIHLETW